MRAARAGIDQHHGCAHAQNARDEHVQLDGQRHHEQDRVALFHAVREQTPGRLGASGVQIRKRDGAAVCAAAFDERFRQRPLARLLLEKRDGVHSARPKSA